MGVKITFDGNIAANNRVSMRTLGVTYSSLQAAFERAWLDIDRNGISKGERMSASDYEQVKLYLDTSEEGCYIAKFIEGSGNLIEVINHTIRSILDPYEIAMSNGDLEQDRTLKNIRSQSDVITSINNAIDYDDLQERVKSGDILARSYADKAIASNVNKALVPVRKDSGESSITLTLHGTQTQEFYFDKRISERFSKLVSLRNIGPLVEYNSHLVSLDGNNPARLRGTVRHVSSKKEANLIVLDVGDYNILAPYLEKDNEGHEKKAVGFYGFPIKEFGSFDPLASDILFYGLAAENG